MDQTNDYHKVIAEDHFFYERSCIRQTFFPGSEAAFLKIMRDILGKDIFDEPNLHTCSAIGYHADLLPLETTMTVVARILALMTQAGYANFVPSCVTSFGLFIEITEMWKEHPEILEQTRQTLFDVTGRTFDTPVTISHPSDLIYKFRFELKEKMIYSLVNRFTGKPLRVVDHIGCHYAKTFPQYGIGGAEFPRVLSGLVEAWGGEPVDYPERRHCCGYGFRQYLVQENRGYSIANAKKKFDSMEPYEPDFIVANCPGCAMFLDKWQYTIAEMENKTYDKHGYGIPVLTYEEMTGLLLGFDPWKLGLQLHQVQVERLLEKMGIPYNLDDKYKGKSGKILPKPEKPRNLLG